MEPCLQQTGPIYGGRKAKIRNCEAVPDDYVVNVDLSRKEFFEKVFAEFTKRKNKFYIFDVALGLG